MIKTKNSRIAVIVIVVVVIVLAALAVLVMRNENSEKHQETSSRPLPSQAQENPETESQGPTADLTSDLLGRRVASYGSDEGKVLSENLYQPTGDMCAGSEKVRVPAEAEIQRSHGVMTIWSTTDGPSGISEGIPTGYSHSPVGAALAGANANALLGADHPTIASVLDQSFHWGSDQGEAVKAAKEQLGAQSSESAPRQGAESIPVPEAFRVVSCANDLVVVELAQPMVADINGPTNTYWNVIRLPMVWSGSNWLINAMDNNAPIKERVDELGGDWAKWEF